MILYIEEVKLILKILPQIKIMEDEMHVTM